jgi:FlaA1/EpsC-like NDP-sugar epimerase
MTLRGRHLALLDTVATIASFVGAFALRFDAPSPIFAEQLGLFAWVLVLLLPVRLASLYVARLYQRVWRYASVGELISIVGAVAASSGIVYLALYIAAAFQPEAPGFPRSVPILETLIAITLLGAMRFSLRIGQAGRRGGPATSTSDRTLIVGAGSAGAAIAGELRSNRSLALRPVGFVDDDLPLGQRIFGIPVVARTQDLAQAIDRHGAGTVLIALPAAEGKQMRRLVKECERMDVKALTVPSLAEVVTGRISPTTVRKIEVEDLLRRSPARIDMAAVRIALAGQVVLITGAGGSIGGELARQITSFAPRQVYLLGKGENSIFEITEGLAASGLVTPVIMDIRDAERLDALVRAIRPDVIFHAAAHKHVHFMEQYPEEAIATNVFGTANLLQSAERAGVKHLVSISTDKAVNPTSVMGATKRVAEMLVQATAMRTRREYVSVRFGNVLSSRGSVVPLFRRQIERGGPITLTHEDVTRYFMTIPEAVQLVLQAAVLGHGGEIFVLDMGEPVRIRDLAEQLAELHDLELGVDIRLDITGLRPGEKMHEELFYGDELPERTTHEHVFVARSTRPILDSAAVLAHLGKLAPDADGWRIRSALTAIVPEYSALSDRLLPSDPS